MLSILWRLAALVVLMPFLMFPVVNFVALPLFLYLLVSVAARAWRRTTAPQPAE